MGTFTYTFEPVTGCNMCGATSARVIGRRLNRHQGLRARRAVGITTTVMQCRTCGLVYSNPRPVPSEIGQHYDREPETYWTSETLAGGEDHFGHEAATFFELWGGDGQPAALDIGAGTGRTMLALGAKRFDAFGVEPSRPFHARALEAGIEPGRLRLSPLETAEFEAGRFDLVTFGAVLEHLQDPAGSLERALGWTAPGGLIHVEVPSADWLMAAALNLAYRILGTEFVTNLSPMHPPYHLFEFTPESFRRHAQRAGYEVAGVMVHVCDTHLRGVADRVARRVMQISRTGKQLEVWLRKT